MTGDRKNVVADKSFAFAVRIVNLFKYLQKEKQEFVLSKQVLRSGTSIGANISEAIEGQSKKDFIAKMSIALKEARESQYWIKLLSATNYLEETQTKNILIDLDELIKILTSIIKTTRESENGK